MKVDAMFVLKFMFILEIIINDLTVIGSSINSNSKSRNKMKITVFENYNPVPKVVDEQTTLSCFKREYLMPAIKMDEFGRRCWDLVKVMACWGRCDSGEIADWRFPYKKSFHSVCTHQLHENITIELKHCDEGVQPFIKKFTYLNAITCICKICPSSSTSCEGMSYYRAKLYDLVKFSSKPFHQT